MKSNKMIFIVLSKLCVGVLLYSHNVLPNKIVVQLMGRLL